MNFVYFLNFFNRYDVCTDFCRYLIFFDDGYAQYVHHNMVFLIVEASKDVWEDIYDGNRDFIKKYLQSYPERSMVKLMNKQTVRIELNGTNQQLNNSRLFIRRF